MRRSAITFVLNSSTVDALLLMAHLRRFANMQDELAEFDALKGQIYTSPGQAQRRPGLRTQNDLSLFFQSGLAHRAKPDWKKRELGCEVSFTQGGGSLPLTLGDIVFKTRFSWRASENDRNDSTKVCVGAEVCGRGAY